MEVSILDQVKLWIQRILVWLSSVTFQHLVDVLLMVFVAGIAGVVTDRILRSRAIGLTASTLCFAWLFYQRFLLGQEWIRPFAGVVLILSFVLGLLLKLWEWMSDDRRYAEWQRRKGRRR